MLKYLWEATFKDGHIIRQPLNDRETGARPYHIGFGGMNTCDEADGRAIVINDEGEYTLASELPRECAIIKL